MASVTYINGKYRALVRRKGHKHISKRFAKEAPAWAWAASIEAQMDAGKIIGHGEGETVARIIKRYQEMRSKTRPILDTSNEHYVLKMLTRTMGSWIAADITPDDLAGWALARRDEGAGPYTINLNLGRLGTVFRYAGKGLPDIAGAARPKLSYLGLIGGGGLRQRRPTEDEMARILEWFAANKGPKYSDFIRFAAITAMRLGEICAMQWADIDQKRKMASVLTKHPRKGKVLEVMPLLADSLEILNRQPNVGPRVFMTHPQTMSKYFTECCRALSIPDLHFHDLRHEGISAMFEEGYDIPHVAVVSRHKSWSHLKRYTQIDPETLHDFKPRLSPGPGTGQGTPPRPARRKSGGRQGK